MKAEQGSILVMPAPDEAGITSSVDAATMKSDGRDHWNALSAASAMLLRFRQPLGGVLGDWVADVLDGKVTKPDGRKSARWPKNKLRDATIAEAISTLMRCGMQAMTNDRSPGPACAAVAEAFSLSEANGPGIFGRHPPTDGSPGMGVTNRQIGCSVTSVASVVKLPRLMSKSSAGA